MIAVDIDVCIGTCCHLMGSGELLGYLEELSEHLSDVKLVIGYSTCMDDGDCTCQGCPKVRIDGTIMRKATPDTLREAIYSIVKAAQPA